MGPVNVVNCPHNEAPLVSLHIWSSGQAVNKVKQSDQHLDALYLDMIKVHVSCTMLFVIVW